MNQTEKEPLKGIELEPISLMAPPQTSTPDDDAPC